MAGRREGEAKVQRDAKVLELAKAGMSEREIGRELGISRSAVWSIKQAAKR